MNTEQEHALGLAQTFARLQAIENQLQALGLAQEQFGEIQALLHEYGDIMAGIDQERDKQFWDDAYDLAGPIKAGNKVEVIARFLRKFAEHVVRQVLADADLRELPASQTRLVVDRLVGMSQQVDSERAESR